MTKATSSSTTTTTTKVIEPRAIVTREEARQRLMQISRCKDCKETVPIILQMLQQTKKHYQPKVATMTKTTTKVIEPLALSETTLISIPICKYCKLYIDKAVPHKCRMIQQIKPKEHQPMVATMTKTTSTKVIEPRVSSEASLISTPLQFPYIGKCRMLQQTEPKKHQPMVASTRHFFLSFPLNENNTYE